MTSLSKKSREKRGKILSIITTIRKANGEIKTFEIDPYGYDKILFTYEAVKKHAPNLVKRWCTGGINHNPVFILANMEDSGESNLPDSTPDEARPEILNMQMVVKYPDGDYKFPYIDAKKLDAILISNASVMDHLDNDDHEWNTGNWENNPAMLLVAQGQEKHCYWSCSKPQHPTPAMSYTIVKTKHNI